MFLDSRVDSKNQASALNSRRTFSALAGGASSAFWGCWVTASELASWFLVSGSGAGSDSCPGLGGGEVDASCCGCAVSVQMWMFRCSNRVVLYLLLVRVQLYLLPGGLIPQPLLSAPPGPTGLPVCRT